MNERFHGRKRSVAGHDDFIARPDALELVQQIDNHRPGRAQDALRGAGVGGELGFKGLALGRQDVLAGADGAQRGLLDFGVHKTFGQGDFAHKVFKPQINTDETQIFSKDHPFILNALAAKVDQIARHIVGFKSRPDGLFGNRLSK
jgi:hypothetical protein